MSSFKPYHIRHWQLAALKYAVIPAANEYWVFWWRQLPLGHCWLGPQERKTTTAALFQQIAATIQPVLEYLFDQQERRVPQDWKAWLEAVDFAGLADGLDAMAIAEKSHSAKLPSLSVVICTYKRADVLEQCLKALLACTDNDLEVIVVDNAPEDRATATLVRQFPAVQYVPEYRKGLDIARNKGAHTASRDIVAYIDDDVTVPPNWVHTVKSSFGNPLTMAVTGLVIPVELETRAQYIFEREWGFNKGYLPVTFDHRYFLDKLDTGVPAWDVGAGANMAFRREAFQLAGWFDERLDAGASGCSGDSEMWYRILAEGWNCFYNPHLYAFHQHRRSMAELRHQLYHYMRGHVSALLVQYENYGHRGNLYRLYRGFPRHYYYRLKEKLRHPGRRYNEALFTEMRGCIAGWQYYRAHKKQARHDIYAIPEAMNDRAPAGKKTLVSVVIPCYNLSHFLPDAIESVLQQTHQKTEIIVVDDGSTDETAAVCERYGEAIRYVRVERVGLSAARNIGVQHASGDFVLFLDADDFLYPSALEINLYYFDHYKEVVLVSGAHVRVDKEKTFLTHGDNPVKYGDNYEALLQGNYIGMASSVLYRRSLFFHYHFDTSMSSCEDYDLNLRIARDWPVFGHDEVIVAYRMHGENMSGNSAVMQKEAIRALDKQLAVLSNETERTAHQKGLENWRSYYA